MLPTDDLVNDRSSNGSDNIGDPLSREKWKKCLEALWNRNQKVRIN